MNAFGRESVKGSSPLTRGKLLLHELSAGEIGLIPAHAGKTSRSSAARSRRWAHPRSRGENLFASIVIVPSWGSSPLTRGKRLAVR